MINSPIIILDIVPPFWDLLEKWMKGIKNNLKKNTLKSIEWMRVRKISKEHDSIEKIQNEC